MNCDLAKLALQGRAKSASEPWSEKELHAIYQLKIPHEYVRRGVLDVEKFEKVKAEVEAAEAVGDKPLFLCSREELCQLAGQFNALFWDKMPLDILFDNVKFAIEKEAVEVEEVEPEVEPVVEPVVEQPANSCEHCDFVGKNAHGLRLHMKKHEEKEVAPVEEAESPQESE